MPRNVFPYPGNKARHAEWIISHIPEHTCYVEPFGGAAGVLFNKPKSKVEVYNDIDDDLVHFFHVFRESPKELKGWLKGVPFSRSLFHEWADDFYDGKRPDDDIERAGQFFALRYMQWGGVYYAKKGFATKATGSGAAAFKNKVNALEPFADRLRDIVIENLNWEEVISRYDRPGTVFYCDPPYPDDANEGYYGLEEFDHAGLCETLSEIDGMAIVSYDRILPFYGDGWQVETRESKFHINSKADSNKDCTEYLIMNFDANGEPLMSGVGQQALEQFAD